MFEEVIEKDVKTTLREHYDYGEASISQFWDLAGEAICNEVYTTLTAILQDKADFYSEVIGSES